MSDWCPLTTLPDLRRIGVIAFDTETKDDRLRAGKGSGWPTHEGYICGVSVAYHEGNELRAHYFPIRHPDSNNFDVAHVFAWLRDLLASDVRIVTQNGLYDFGWLHTEADIKMPPVERLEEIGALATIVDENRYSYRLGDLCTWRGLPGKDETALQEGAAALGLPKRAKPAAHIWQMPASYVGPYAERDAASTLALFESLNPVLDHEGTRGAYRLEVDLLPMVHEMRRRGVRIDTAAAESARDQLLQKRDAAFTELSEKLGAAISMAEIGRNKWLAETFDKHGIKYPRTKKGNPSFTAGTTGWMHKHSHWLPQLIAKADKYNKAGVDFLEGHILGHVVNERIHAEIHPHRSDEGGTRSLRFSYSNPPLQQMAARDEEIAPLIRGVFLPEEGQVWAKPDISQQEFRFIVHYAAKLKLTGAEKAAERYRADPNTDFHALASELTKIERKQAKNVNFAKAFGAGVRKFAAMIGKPESEARAIYDRYDRTLPFVQQLSKRCANTAAQRGYLELYDGARRHWNDWVAWVNWKGTGSCSREEAERRINDPLHSWYRKGPPHRIDTHKAMNALIQGSAARHTKLWMLACWREGIVPLLQMHDCLDLSVSSPEQAERVAQLGREAVTLEVPIQVDLKFGKSWGDAVHNWDELCNGIKVSGTLLTGHPDSGQSEITHQRPFMSVAPEADHNTAVESSENSGNPEDQDDGAGGNNSNGANGHERTDGSKTEADHDTYAEDNAGQPFHDAYLRAQGYGLAHVFDYTLPDGTLLCQQNRYELRATLTATKKRPRKRFLPHRKVNGSDILGAGARRVIYNWPAVMRAGPGATIAVTEGEANAKALIKAGLLATTVLSHKWTPECVAALTGCHVSILEDHDDDGRKLSAIARKLLAPIAASIRIVPTAHLWKHLKPPHRKIELKDDVENWTELGGDPAKLFDICRELPAEGIIEAEPYKVPPEEQIAPWAWLYGRHLLRGEVAGTVAMGGTGKSSSSIVEALAMTSGKPLLGEDVPRPLRVVLVNLEDTRNTMDKRIVAAMQHYGLTQADIGDRLIVKAKGEIKIKVARQLRSGDVERDETIIGALVKVMVKHAADVLSIDSFIRTHKVNENDNSAIEDVVECFEQIAIQAQCAGHLWHHTRKQGGEKATVESARGASAFIDAVRSARVFETMSTKVHAELKAVQPELMAPGYYFRSFNGKRNFAPPADQSDWFKLESIALRNGDNVGVVTPWQYPETWSDLSPELIDHIIEEIGAGMSNGQRYSGAKSAKPPRAAWCVVQKHCPEKPESQCREIIRTWIDNGELISDEYDDPVQRKKLAGLFRRREGDEQI